MKTGKLKWEELQDIISISRGSLRDDVIVRSNIGEDCSIISFGEYECVLSTDPITGADKDIGRLAVNINCNDIASSGVEPIGILVTILAPSSAEIHQIRQIMKEIDEEAKKLNIEILGGHTEVTEAVNKFVISCTVIGKGKKGRSIPTCNARLGDDIVVTKSLGLEGTSIIVNDYPELVAEFLSRDEVAEAKEYIKDISVLNEGLIAGSMGVHSMHDITEGGILGALWEIAVGSNKGFKIYEDKLPVTQVTEKLCKQFNIDLTGFISSGSMVITTENGKELVKELKAKGINAVIIGNITESEYIMFKQGVAVSVMSPERDELFAFKEKFDNMNCKISK